MTTIALQPRSSDLMDRVAGSAESASRGRVLPVLLVAAVAAVLVGQFAAAGDYSSVRDPLSMLYWTSQGWLFSAALLAMSGALFVLARRFATAGRFGSWPAALLGLAGTGSGLAAVFPADPADALAVSAAGETHRWGSTAALVLPLVAALSVCRQLRRSLPGRDGTADAAARRTLRLLMLGAGVSGLLFLGGFLPGVLAVDVSALDGLAAVNGLVQRLLALLMVLAVWRLGVMVAGIPRVDPPVDPPVDPVGVTAVGDRTGVDRIGVDPVAAGAFRPIELQVGGIHQPAERSVPGIQFGVADAGRHPLVAEPAETSVGHVGTQPVRNHPRRHSGGVRQQDRELFPAEPTEDIGATHGLPHDLPEAVEHVVAGQMPVGVVDPFEVIQIEHQQGGRGGPAEMIVDHRAGLRQERRPGQRTGQLIDSDAAA